MSFWNDRSWGEGVWGSVLVRPTSLYFTLKTDTRAPWPRDALTTVTRGRRVTPGKKFCVAQPDCLC